MTDRPDRAVRQYLESLARAGVSHLPRPTLVEPVETAESAGAAPGSRVTAEESRRAEPRVVPSAAVPAAVTNVRPAAPPEGAPMPASERAPTDVAASITSQSSVEERGAALAVVSRCVAGCTRCGELAATRTQTVFGVGNPAARLLFLGEAPGADEDLIGEPFVGKAGQKLNDIIRACGLGREDVYICNVLRCRPPGNRNPSDKEAANCREYLDAQLTIVRPEYVVCWGSIAAQSLLGVKTTIGQLRGRFHEHAFAGTRAKVLCTYHPAYLLRNPAAKKDVWADMKFLFRDMGVEL
jgi:uracil-DNA glycosylase